MTYNRKKQSKNLIDDWADIRRYSNPEKGLSEKSCKILSSVRYLIKKYDEAILTHEEIAKITRRKSDQNSNLVKELGFVQNIEFHRVLVRDDKKYNNAFIFTDNENTDEILENPEEYFANLFAENSGQEPKKFGANLTHSIYIIKKIKKELIIMIISIISSKILIFLVVLSV